MVAKDDATDAAKASTPSAPAPSPTGVSAEKAAANAEAAKNAEKTAGRIRNVDEDSKFRTVGEDGQPLLNVEIEDLDTTVHGKKVTKTADEGNEKRDTKKEAPITTVAQLRDKGLEVGVMPASSQVEEVRERETKALEKLGQEHRPPASERGGKK